MQDKPALPEYKSESDQSKFNMELNDQKALHAHLTLAAESSLVNDPIGRFRALKQARVVLSQRLPLDEQRESLLKQQKVIQGLVNKFDVLTKSLNIIFNPAIEDFSFSQNVEVKKFPKEFHLLRFASDIAMDSWEENMRKHMIELGLIAVKRMGGEDAA